MTSQAIPLTAFDLALAAFLLVINGGLSLWLGLGITRSLVIAAVRMTVQLLLVGLVLKALFAQQSPWLTLGVVGTVEIPHLIPPGFHGNWIAAS